MAWFRNVKTITCANVGPVLCRHMVSLGHIVLTHWGRETHTCVNKLSIIGSDNGLSPGRRQTIIWTNAGILSIGPIGAIFNDKVIEIHTFSLKKIHFKMSSGKWQPFCLGLNVLTVDRPIHVNWSITRIFCVPYYREVQSNILFLLHSIW